MKIGPYDVQLLELGRFGMDGGGFFGVVPKVLWSRAYPHVDAENRVEVATYALLIRGNGRTVVVDAGIGDKLDPKKTRIFGMVQEGRALERALETQGVEAQDVTDFVYTHLHFDHAGGATRWGTPLGRDGGGADAAAVPVFPRAQHVVQAAQLAWARRPSDKDRASYLPENWEPVASGGLLTELNGTTELLPGVELRPVSGHTESMQMVIIRGEVSGDAESGGSDESILTGCTGLVFSVDLFPTAAHLPAHYIAAFDNHPLLVLEEKRALLEEAANQRLLLCFGHDPFTPAAVIRRSTKGFEIESRVKLTASPV